MCHVCGFICYLCVELKLMINTRSLSNQALKSVHPSLLSSRCWPWGVFIGGWSAATARWGQGHSLAWVRPVPTSDPHRWDMVGCLLWVFWAKLYHNGTVWHDVIIQSHIYKSYLSNGIGSIALGKGNLYGGNMIFSLKLPEGWFDNSQS